jgi:hypothetical protein
LPPIIEVWRRLAKSPIFARVPHTEDPDHRAGHFISHLIPANDEAPNLAREIPFNPFAKSGMFDEALRGCRKRRDQVRGDRRVNAYKKIVEAAQIGDRFIRPVNPHRL